MGMYTELVCAFELPSDTPQVVINILRYMTGETDSEPEVMPDHKLFNEGSRWRFMLRCDSYYFEGDTHSTIRKDKLFGGDKLNSYYVTIRCNLKNYNDEIENFIDWITPYIQFDGEEKGGKFIGYSRYESEQTPKLIYV